MEISEFLETEEAKQAIKDAAKSIAEEEVKGLKSKNTELLGKIKSFQEQLDEIKTAKENAENKAIEQSGDIEKIKENLKSQFEKERDALLGKIRDKDSALHGLLIDNGLTDSLNKAGVAPQHIDVIKAYIKSTNKAEIIEGDNGLIAQMNGKPLTEFVSEWAQGDQAKQYIAAPNNTGGGANGANGNGKAATVKKADMTDKQKTEFIRENGLEAYKNLK